MPRLPCDSRLFTIPLMRFVSQPPPRKLKLADLMSSRARLELRNLDADQLQVVVQDAMGLLLEGLATENGVARSALSPSPSEAPGESQEPAEPSPLP